jgi:hypothetical protein
MHEKDNSEKTEENPTKSGINLHGPGKSNMISKMGGMNKALSEKNINTENKHLQTLEKIKKVENTELLTSSGNEAENSSESNLISLDGVSASLTQSKNNSQTIAQVIDQY